MTKADFKVEVVSREAVVAVGLKVRTNMAQAEVDCPKLWHDNFAPRMAEIQGFPTTSFGISKIVDEENFDYWAAMPLEAGAPIPGGMTTIDLPAGLYAQCQLKSLEELAAAYQHIFLSWAPASGYEIPCDRPSYELYPVDHFPTGKLTLFMPVNRKSG